jgi:hypothetical protein
MRLNGEEEVGGIHICIIDYVACDNIDICIVKDYAALG